MRRFIALILASFLLFVNAVPAVSQSYFDDFTGGGGGGGNNWEPEPPPPVDCTNILYEFTGRFVPEDPANPVIFRDFEYRGPITNLRVDTLSDFEVVVRFDHGGPGISPRNAYQGPPLSSANLLGFIPVPGQDLSTCTPAPSDSDPVFSVGPGAGTDGGNYLPDFFPGGDGSNPNTEPDGDADGDGVPNSDDSNPLNPDVGEQFPSPVPPGSDGPDGPQDPSPPPSTCDAIVAAVNPFQYLLQRMSTRFPFDIIGTSNGNSTLECPSLSFFGETYEFCIVVDFFNGLKWIVWCGFVIKVIFFF